MSFDTKIAVLVRDDLATWQRLNATAFMVSGIAGAVPELLGEEYVDADGTRYLPMFGQPVLVFEGDADTLKAAHAREPLEAKVDLDQSGWLAEGFLCLHAVHRWNQNRRPAFEGSGHSARSHRRLLTGSARQEQWRTLVAWRISHHAQHSSL